MSRRLSGFGDEPRRIALAGLTVLAVVVCGCGDGNPRREHVDRFLHRVNSVQRDFAPPFKRANKAYLSFSKGKLGAAVAVRELSAAEQAMRNSRDELAALPAPADARKLRRLLVDLLDADAAMAHEATLLARFVPAAQAVSKPLPRMGRRLSSDLKSSSKAPAQEAALARYARGLQKVIAGLEPLNPPPLLIDRHSRQVQHLRAVRRLSLRLAASLKANDGRAVAKLLLRFRKLSSDTTSTSRVSRTALRSYGRRRTAVLHALQAVEREQSRLERTLR